MTHEGDIQILVSKDLVQKARDIRVDLGRSLLFFKALRADAELTNGARI